MAKFKKMFAADVVRVSDTRVLRKLTTDLPIWNGTDLTGTNWMLRSGWTAEAGYGVFDINIRAICKIYQNLTPFNNFHIGYTDSVYGVRPAMRNRIAFGDLFNSIGSIDNEKVAVLIQNGTDATNLRLIDWMIHNADLVSHQPAHKGGLYDADDNLVASWDALVNTYGMNVEKSYLGQSYKTDPASPYNVLANNSELLAGTKIVISDKVTSIGVFAFGECTALTSIVIPVGVGFAASAFYSCTSLTSIVIPNGVEYIATSVFRDCTSLTSITLPDSVTEIALGAFTNCTSLTDVYYRGTEEQWNAIYIWSAENEYLTNATIHYNSQ